MTTPHYKAFISYSHRDEAWARWLQRSLEAYRVPRRLVGQQGSKGTIPSHLCPVFRDREDLSSAADLSSQIKTELDHSENLVVICSPAAAKSAWVSEEIRYFRQLGRSARILALVVEGDPQSIADGQGCFPPALLETDAGGHKEPLAADVRKYADGKHLALLKIVAGLLGIRLDELRRRDAQRSLRQRLVVSVLVLALGGVISWLWLSEAKTRANAAAQRANTEELLGFMLGDLKRLAPIEGLEFIPADDGLQQHFREAFEFNRLDNPALAAAGLQWREAGLDSKRQSDLNATLDLFQRSRAAFIELNQRDSTSLEAQFELGQAEYYVGEAYYGMGETDLAEQAWARYGAVTRRLVNADPNNARYVMELSYTLTNLGALELGRPRPNTTRLLQLIQAGVQYNQVALVLDPGNAEYRDALPNNLAWQADAWLEKCELEQALEIRQQAVQLRQELLAEAPDVRLNQMELALKLTGLAGVQRLLGQNSEARSNFERIDRIFTELHRAEPNDSELEWEMYYRQARFARHLLSLGEFEQAGEVLEGIAGRYDELSNPELTGDYQRGFEAARSRLDRALVLLALGEDERGRKQLQQVTKELEQMLKAKPEARDGLEALALAELATWRLAGGDFAAGESPALQFYLAGQEPLENCSDADTAARLAIMNGEQELAKSYTGYVLGKGYREAGFLAFCHEYGLCELP